MRTLLENFEGFSQILKEQSAQKRYLDVFTHLNADTFGKLWRFLTDFKGTISPEKVFRCVYTSNSNNSKIWNSAYQKKKSGVCIVVDYADTQFSNFTIEYLHENKKICETVCACFESFRPKKWSKISWHCPFNFSDLTWLSNLEWPSFWLCNFVARASQSHHSSNFALPKLQLCRAIAPTLHYRIL